MVMAYAALYDSPAKSPQSSIKFNSSNNYFINIVDKSTPLMINKCYKWLATIIFYVKST